MWIPPDGSIYIEALQHFAELGWYCTDASGAVTAERVFQEWVSDDPHDNGGTELIFREIEGIDNAIGEYRPSDEMDYLLAIFSPEPVMALFCEEKLRNLRQERANAMDNLHRVEANILYIQGVLEEERKKGD